MIYECDNCEAALGPGLTVCPRCGQVFDDPVPDDALWDEPAPTVVFEVPVESPDSVEASAAGFVTRSGPKRRSRGLPLGVVSLFLLGLCWLGSRDWVERSASPAVLIPAPRPPTDLAAHPQYVVNMTALVQKLRATGVGAVWPAFGSDDVLLITPLARAAEPPVAWDADMDRRLAQGIYGDFAQTRFESGFPDGDTTACFVLVTGATGQVVAVDFMGNLE